MKYTTISLLCFAAIMLCVQSCDLFDKADKKDELPPATQEGRNTFGCLVNGKVWLPKGKVGSTSNLDASYDPSYADGSFDLDAYRSTNNEYSSIYIYMSQMDDVGVYNLCCSDIGTAIFDFSSDCHYDRDNSIYRSGHLTISKFDISSQIISGVFEFKLHKLGCDTLKVTEGRFDMKF